MNNRLAKFIFNTIEFRIVAVPRWTPHLSHQNDDLSAIESGSGKGVLFVDLHWRGATYITFRDFFQLFSQVTPERSQPCISPAT